MSSGAMLAMMYQLLSFESQHALFGTLIASKVSSRRGYNMAQRLDLVVQLCAKRWDRSRAQSGG
jgi:hypothetical protein